MTKRKYLKKLKAALKGVPKREREELVAYYAELIDESYAHGKTEEEIFSKLDPPEAAAENYLRERPTLREEEEGGHVRNAAFDSEKFVLRILAVFASFNLAVLALASAAAGYFLATEGVFDFFFSFGLLVSGHAAIFFAQWGMAFVLFALAMLLVMLTVFLVKALVGMWRAVCGRPFDIKFMKKGTRCTLITSCAMLLGGALLFVSAFGALGFDYKNLAVTGDIIDHEQEISFSDALTLEADGLDITVKRSEDETCKLLYRDFPEKPITFAYADGKVTLNYPENAIGLMDDIGVLWRHGLLIEVLGGSTRDAVLLLPASFSGALTVKMDDGDVSIADMVYTDLVISVQFGTISLENITADTVSAETEYGDIIPENVEADTVNAETWYGDIRLHDVKAESVRTKTGSGDIALQNVTCTHATVSTRSGAATLENLSADDISLRADSGSVTGTISGSEEEYTITASVGTGSCNLHDRTGGSKKLEVQVSAGSVRVEFTG